MSLKRNFLDYDTNGYDMIVDGKRVRVSVDADRAWATVRDWAKYNWDADKDNRRKW